MFVSFTIFNYVRHYLSYPSLSVYDVTLTPRFCSSASPPFTSFFFLFNPGSGANDAAGSSIGPSFVLNRDLLFRSSVSYGVVLQKEMLYL
jgi:hypothetical protein